MHSLYAQPIKRLLFTLLLLCFAQLSMPQGAKAEERSFSDDLPLQPTNWSRTLAIPRFEPVHGLLTKVEVVLTGQVSGSARLENLDAAPALVTAESVADLQLERPDGIVITNVSPMATRTERLQAFDHTLDYGGTSGLTIDDLVGFELSERIVYTDATALQLFMGDGYLDLRIRATGRSRATGAGNLALGFRTAAGAAVTVTYTSVQPAIDLEKLTNGEDADLLPGPLVAAGAPITWHYLVHNIGEIDLEAIRLFDDREGDMMAHCPQQTLAVDEQMICLFTGIAQAGQYTNTAVVTATTPADSLRPNLSVTDEDPSHYFGTQIAVCPIDEKGMARLPTLRYLGEGVGEYRLVEPEEQLIIKQFGPFRFTNQLHSPYRSTHMLGAPERLWACSGDCRFIRGWEEILDLGFLPAESTLHLVLIDDDDDDRINTLFANDQINQPLLRITEASLTRYLSVPLPEMAAWHLNIADSIGLYLCVAP